MIEIPVLLIGFNRPDTIQKVFDKIRDVEPKKLYVSIDGPRQGKVGEDKLCDEVKSIVQKVDWQCESFYLFNEKNRGAELTVSNAVSWALKNEEYVIVLEDDVVVPKSFFEFMQDMLLKYKDEQQVGMVSGCNYTPVKIPNNEDYLFGIHGHTWGWGTWKRAWQMFDLNINDFDNSLKPEFLNKISNSESEKKYYNELFSRMKLAGKGGNTWDHCWYYIRITRELLSVIPRVNLTSNIGIYGFHADGETENHFRNFDNNFKAKIHPASVLRNVAYDKYHFNHYQNPLLYIKIIRKVKRIIKSLFN